MNGSGIATRSSSPIATVAPEKITARPAVAIVRRIASSFSRPARELLTEAVDDEQRVVDRDPEADQLDQVRDVRRRAREMGDAVHQAERGGDRARREDERHRHRDRQPEHREEHEQGDREGDALAALQILGEDRVEVVLNRSGTGDVRAHDTGRKPDRTDDRGSGVLRLSEIEPAVEVAVDDLGAGGRERRRASAARNNRGGAVDDALKPSHDTRVVRVRDLEDDRERALGHLSELLREERPRALRVGARHAELVREQR